MFGKAITSVSVTTYIFFSSCRQNAAYLRRGSNPLMSGGRITIFSGASRDTPTRIKSSYIQVSFVLSYDEDLRHDKT